MSHSRFAAVILAAGFSSRMGRFKPLLDLGGKPLIERVIFLFRECGIADIRVVTGHCRAELSPLLEKLNVDTVHNPDFEEGMYSSVTAGVRHLLPDTTAFFVLPVDIPLVRHHTVRNLMTLHKTRTESVLIPRFQGKNGHPPLLPGNMIEPILNWPGDGGLRGLLATDEISSFSVDVWDRNILFDTDSPDDYQKLLHRWQTYHLPASEECDALLSELPERLEQHCRQVAEVAERLGKALIQTGLQLDLALIRASALLHDIAKGEPDHAEAGGHRLSEMGFPEVGNIVAAHTDLPENPGGAIREADIVYLADKYVAGNRCVLLSKRFDRAAERFADDPDALAAVERRRRQAFYVRDRLARQLGRSVESVLVAE